MSTVSRIFSLAMFVLLVAEAPCLGQEPAPFSFPAPGTRWQMLVTAGGKTVTESYAVLEDGEHAGAKVHRVSISDGLAEPRIELSDLETGNWITTMVGGKQHRHLAAKPYFALYAWPLTVGKVWQTRFTFGTMSVREMRGVVNAFEEVTVPAGTFRAYKVDVADAAWFWAPYRTTYWYAPAIGLVVKREEWSKETGVRQSVLKAYRLVEP